MYNYKVKYLFLIREHLKKFKQSRKVLMNIIDYKGMPLLQMCFKNLELGLCFNENSEYSSRLELVLYRDNIPSNTVNLLEHLYPDYYHKTNREYNAYIILALLDFIKNMDKIKNKTLYKPIELFKKFDLNVDEFLHLKEERTKNTFLIKYFPEKDRFFAFYFENSAFYYKNKLVYQEYELPFKTTLDSFTSFIDKNKEK